MAGQRVRTPEGGATGRTGRGYPPAQRQAPQEWSEAGPEQDGRARDAHAQDGPARGGRAQQRRADSRRTARAQAPSTRPFSGVAVLLSLGLPAAGGLADQLFGLGIGGWGLLLCSVAGFAGAAAVCSRTGWWWVLPAPPPIVLAVTAATAYLAHSDDYKGGKKLAAGAAKWAIQGFPVMLYAMGAALLVILVRTVRDRRSPRG
ncbi:DUF6542 domain-containing protein [Kitasatospora viridis]|uniref:DUF6542 domain-containing protein n=1 Tax=Kitasatospora viridis TaxID=281105 RepID=A0A561UH01_9ACTN|nr:DUF6542 domain-containing protein [Kitasatospora viridis]TWF98636.1 hypothetical protein FHX73_112457 [Kitasatospora viridis]